MGSEYFNISAMTKQYSVLISLWKYDGDYSFYNHNESNIDGYMDGTHFACLSSNGDLIGFFCFGKGARIPTIENDVYGDDFLDVGLGLRPNLCGKGLGLTFLNHGLKFAQKMYNTNHFRLSVAAFNERAIKVYQKAGFNIKHEVTNSYFKNKFFIMKYTLKT